MQILGKRSKVLLIVIAIIMLVAVGVSFAMWDSISVVKATTGYVSYSSAQVGDLIQYGRYYQTGIIGDDGEYEKTPIDWLVVDKDERIGQLTLMSKYILACGSYFGNYYYNANVWSAHYDSNATVAGIQYNQAYVDSTVRAYLNNLERLDLGGDAFTSGIGYVPSKTNSSISTGLLSSVGFSNQKYWTGLSYATMADKELVDKGNTGLTKRYDNNEIYYRRPINNEEYKNRPATRGFIDEAFNNEEKAMIIPKQIAGYTGHRWPDNVHDIATKSYVEGALDKVWLPSATELNVMNAKDWNEQTDEWTISSDEAASTVFSYFKDLSGDNLTNALRAKRTVFAENSFAMNYSIPVYKKSSTEANIGIHSINNSSDHYWTRSPSSSWYTSARTVQSSGLFGAHGTDYSNVGVRPCVILKY